MTGGEIGHCPGWYELIQRVRRASSYLRCDFFELLARLDRGEWHWLAWATVAQDAETAAYGSPWPPTDAVWAVPWSPRRED